MFKTKLDVTNTGHRLFVFRMDFKITSAALMTGLIEYITRIESTWRYRRLDTCLHGKELVTWHGHFVL
jgi:hypothetical protein